MAINVNHKSEEQFQPVKLEIEITSHTSLSALRKMASLDKSIPEVVANVAYKATPEEVKEVTNFICSLHKTLGDIKR